MSRKDKDKLDIRNFSSGNKDTGREIPDKAAAGKEALQKERDNNDFAKKAREGYQKAEEKLQDAVKNNESGTFDLNSILKEEKKENNKKEKTPDKGKEKAGNKAEKNNPGKKKDSKRQDVPERKEHANDTSYYDGEKTEETKVSSENRRKDIEEKNTAASDFDKEEHSISETLNKRDSNEGRERDVNSTGYSDDSHPDIRENKGKEYTGYSEYKDDRDVHSYNESNNYKNIPEESGGTENARSAAQNDSTTESDNSRKWENNIFDESFPEENDIGYPKDDGRAQDDSFDKVVKHDDENNSYPLDTDRRSTDDGRNDEGKQYNGYTETGLTYDEGPASDSSTLAGTGTGTFTLDNGGTLPVSENIPDQNVEKSTSSWDVPSEKMPVQEASESVKDDIRPTAGESLKDEYDGRETAGHVNGEDGNITSNDKVSSVDTASVKNTPSWDVSVGTSSDAHFQNIGNDSYSTPVNRQDEELPDMETGRQKDFTFIPATEESKSLSGKELYISDISDLKKPINHDSVAQATWSTLTLDSVAQAEDGHGFYKGVKQLTDYNVAASFLATSSYAQSLVEYGNLQKFRSGIGEENFQLLNTMMEKNGLGSINFTDFASAKQASKNLISFYKQFDILESHTINGTSFMAGKNEGSEIRQHSTFVGKILDEKEKKALQSAGKMPNAGNTQKTTVGSQLETKIKQMARSPKNGESIGADVVSDEDIKKLSEGLFKNKKFIKKDADAGLRLSKEQEKGLWRNSLSSSLKNMERLDEDATVQSINKSVQSYQNAKMAVKAAGQVKDALLRRRISRLEKETKEAEKALKKVKAPGNIKINKEEAARLQKNYLNKKKELKKNKADFYKQQKNSIEAKTKRKTRKLKKKRNQINAMKPGVKKSILTSVNKAGDLQAKAKKAVANRFAKSVIGRSIGKIVGFINGWNAAIANIKRLLLKFILQFIAVGLIICVGFTMIQVFSIMVNELTTSPDPNEQDPKSWKDTTLGIVYHELAVEEKQWVQSVLKNGLIADDMAPNVNALTYTPDLGGAWSISGYDQTELSTSALERRQKIWTYLTTEFGYTEVAAAGAMGNIQHESGFNPYKLENKYGGGEDPTMTKVKDKQGYGLLQWTDYASQGFYNFTALKQWIAKSGMDNGIEAQLAYMDKVYGKDSYISRGFGGTNRKSDHIPAGFRAIAGTYPEFKTVTDDDTTKRKFGSINEILKQACYGFLVGMENPPNTTSAAAQRASNAVKIYKDLASGNDASQEENADSTGAYDETSGIYEPDRVGISEYAEGKGWVYDYNKGVLGPEPFKGAPADAYKWIKIIDGSKTTTFVDSEGNRSSIRSNVKNIVAMAAVANNQDVDQANFNDGEPADNSELETEGGKMSIWDKIFDAGKRAANIVATTANVVSNVTANLVDNVRVIGDIRRKNARNRAAQKIMIYAKPLFDMSHKQGLNIGMQILPTRRTLAMSGTYLSDNGMTLGENGKYSVSESDTVADTDNAALAQGTPFFYYHFTGGGKYFYDADGKKMTGVKAADGAIPCSAENISGYTKEYFKKITDEEENQQCWEYKGIDKEPVTISGTSPVNNMTEDDINGTSWLSQQLSDEDISSWSGYTVSASYNSGSVYITAYKNNEDSEEGTDTYTKTVYKFVHVCNGHYGERDIAENKKKSNTGTGATTEEENDAIAVDSNNMCDSNESQQTPLHEHYENKGYGCKSFNKFSYNDTDRYYVHYGEDGENLPQVEPAALVYPEQYHACNVPNGGITEFAEAADNNPSCWTAENTGSKKEVEDAGPSEKGSSWIDDHCDGGGNGYKISGSGHTIHVTVNTSGPYEIEDPDDPDDTITVHDESYFTLTHTCAGNHTGYYCGGHISGVSLGMIVGFTDAQMKNDHTKYSGKTTLDAHGQGTPEFRADMNYLDSDSATLTATYADIQKLSTAVDLFDIDMALNHSKNSVATGFIKEGWTIDNMDSAVALLLDNWKELYGIDESELDFSNLISEASSTTSSWSTTNMSDNEKEKLIESAGKELVAKGIPEGTTEYERRMQAVEEATKWVGKVYYTWNGALRSQPLHDGGATDCSGFVSLIWKEKFPDIPSTRAMMSRCQNTSAWKSSSSGNLKPGDIIVYGKEKPNPVTGKSSWSGHAMLYVGIVNGQQMVIEANGSKGDGKSVDYNGGVRYIHEDISRYNCIDMGLL